MIIKTKCPICGEEHHIECSKEGYEAFKNGECIQIALPELSANEREMLVTGTCPRCWDLLFPDEDE